MDILCFNEEINNNLLFSGEGFYAARGDEFRMDINQALYLLHTLFAMLVAFLFSVTCIGGLWHVNITGREERRLLYLV